MIKWTQRLIPLLLIFLFVSACKQQPSFVDKKWILTSYTLSEEQKEIATKTNFQLTFYSYFNFVKVDSRARHEFLKYTIREKDNRLLIYDPNPSSPNMTMDRRTEFPSNLSVQDYRDSDLLSSSTYLIEGNKLTLTSYYGKEHGRQLIFSGTMNYQRLGFFELLGQQIIILLKIIGLPILVFIVRIMEFVGGPLNFLFGLLTLTVMFIWRKKKLKQQKP